METQFNIKKPRHILALIILTVTVLYIFGHPLYGAISSLLFGQQQTMANPTERGIMFSLLLNTLFMVGCSFAWLKLVHGFNLKEILRELKFKRKKMHIALFYGVATTVLFWITMVLILLMIVFFTGFKEENLIAYELGKALSWSGVIVVSLLAALSEETFFRGFLQQRIGIIPASLLFGFVHVGYGTISQVILPVVFGIILGILVIRTRNIFSAVSAHFSFNLVQFFLLKILIMAPIIL